MLEHDDASRGGLALLDAQPDGTDTLADRVERRLRHSPYLALRNLTCTSQGDLVVLRGCLPTYYLKQVAQALAAQVEGVEQVVNEVEVVPSAAVARRG